MSVVSNPNLCAPAFPAPDFKARRRVSIQKLTRLFAALKLFLIETIRPAGNQPEIKTHNTMLWPWG
jgi:hypothetical protein